MKSYYEDLLKLREDLNAFKSQTNTDLAEKDLHYQQTMNENLRKFNELESNLTMNINRVLRKQEEIKFQIGMGQ